MTLGNVDAHLKGVFNGAQARRLLGKIPSPGASSFAVISLGDMNNVLKGFKLIAANPGSLRNNFSGNRLTTVYSKHLRNTMFILAGDSSHKRP